MTPPVISFANRKSVEQVELGDELAPAFGADGLLSAIVVNHETGEILMLGHMNDEALRLSITTREAHFFSRSRSKLWRKGEHSGFTQRIERLLVDDDQDAVILYVSLTGPGSCHVGYRSCFFREIDLENVAQNKPPALRLIEDAPAFDAKRVYAGLPNPTRL